MKLLINNEEFALYKSTDKVSCECRECKQPFGVYKKYITYALKHGTHLGSCCSVKCSNRYTNTKLGRISHTVTCNNCNLAINKGAAEMKKSKSGHSFCSRSCSATYNNKNKKYGTRRSKFEVHMEMALSKKFPQYEILFNHKGAIGSELDIHIPSINLAIELNGIFHYQAIFGDSKLKKIKDNDKKKVESCKKAKIKLVTVDMTNFRSFTKSYIQKYEDIVISEIEKEIFLLCPTGQ